MDPNTAITHDFPPFFKVYKDGRVEWSIAFEDIPDGTDPETEITTKDVVISADTGLKARIFYPKLSGPDQRLSLLVHYHGRGFCVGSPFGSVNKRLAPEHLLPIAYEDTWAALKWIANHVSGLGPEKLLTDNVDFARMFLMGESAGLNIAHHMTIQASANGLDGVKIPRVLLLHPFLGNEEEDKMIRFLSSPSFSCDNLRLHPMSDPNWLDIGCERVLVCMAEVDGLRCRGETYYEALKGSRRVEFYESKRLGHVFFMFQLNEEKDVLIRKVAAFILPA